MIRFSITILLFFSLIIRTSETLIAKNIQSPNQNKTVPGVVIAKLKPGININFISESAQPDLQIRPAFPYHQKSIHLSRIVEIHFPPLLHAEEFIIDISNNKIFEYVEPKYLSFIENTIPNDSLISHQFHLFQTNMVAAWKVHQGSPETIIAIVDNGTEYQHPDLKDNIWINRLEAQGMPGVDDDGNGYADDIHGWDFGNNDNDPTFGTDESIIAVHGTHTAGIASAVTNNTTGIAGVGWNCRIMPIKVSTDDDTYEIPFGYEGIVYAADNGAHIISNSWGRRGLYSQFEQDIINYAVSKGCIIVAAGGNSNTEAVYYPGGYVHVIAVAAVNELDERASYSTYGKFIDLSAPGGDSRIGRPGIFSTYPVERGSYGELSGTSMATPIVAGIMGLLISKFPEFNLLQLTRQVVLTADHIDELNPEYQGLIGFGRVNGFRALTEELRQEEPAKIELFKAAVYDSIWGNGNSLFERNETIGVDVWYRNYAVSPGRNLMVTLATEDHDLIVLNDQVKIDYFAPDTILAIQNILTFKVNPQATPHLCKLTLSYTLENGSESSDTLYTIIGKSSVLLVDDDNGIRNVEAFYTTALDYLGVSYLRWDHAQLGTPPPKTSAHFPMIIWFCEWAFPTLTPQDRMALQYYLNKGGSLFISGQDIGWDLVDPTGIENNQYSENSVKFYQQDLHTLYRADYCGSQTVIGVPGTIGQGMKFNIYQPKISFHFQFPEWIEPATDAKLAFQYENGKGAGVSYFGTYRVLNLGFGFEAVNASQHQDPFLPNRNRFELMQRILDKMGPIHHQPISDQAPATDSLLFTVELSPLVNDLQSLALFWKTDSMADFSELSMSRIENSIFQQHVNIGAYRGKVYYYFQMSTPYVKFYHPVRYQTQPFSFAIGEDRSAPKIYHTPLPDVFVQNKDRPVQVFVEDNVAVDTNSVWLYYNSTNKQDSIQMIPISNYWYRSSIPPIAGFGDSISYYFSARDLATSPNLSISKIFDYKVGFEGFESGLNYWTADSIGWTIDGWESHSGKFCISSFPGDSYEDNIEINLRSKFGLRRKYLKNAVISIWTKYELEEDKDFGFVEISLDNGTSWEFLENPFTGTQDNWIKKSFELGTYYLENEDTLTLRFRLQTDSTQTRPMAGWYIDDISIKQQSRLAVSENDIINQRNLLAVDIYPNSPNPFNRFTKIKYQLSYSGTVTLEVYNLVGQLVTKQLLGFQQPGLHTVVWDGKNSSGISIGSGIYFARLIIKSPESDHTKTISKTLKMVFLE